MNTYFIINLLISSLGALSLLLLTNAPARLRFYVGLFTLSGWLMPWPYLQLSHDIQTFYLPVNLVVELQHLLPDITDASHLSKPPAELSASAWLSIEHLILWFWPLSLTVGLILFSRDVVSYQLLQQKWLRISTPNNQLWQLAGFEDQPCDIRTMNACGPGMATGVLKPVIWINQQQQTPALLHTVLLHELTHIRQHDPLWLWVLNLIKRLFWWNPVVHWLCTYNTRQIELSCDEQCQQILPKGQYQQQLIELTLWSDKQRKKLSTFAENSMPMMSEMSGTRAFNLQRIQHLNKETSMKLRHNLVLAALFSATIGIGLSNATTDNAATTIRTETSDFSPQILELMAAKDYQGANNILKDLLSGIDQYNPQQQFDIWYFSAMNLYQLDHLNPDILIRLDKAFALAPYASQERLSGALKTAVGFSLYLEQPEKTLVYAQLWQDQGWEIPQNSRFFFAVAQYQLKLHDLAINQLNHLINEAETNGQHPNQQWLSLLVGSYSEQGNYAKAYEVQQKNEALYPNEKNQRLLDELKQAAQSS